MNNQKATVFARTSDKVKVSSNFAKSVLYLLYIFQLKPSSHQANPKGGNTLFAVP